MNVWKTFTQAEHDQIQITGYWLRKNSVNEACVVDLSDPATQKKAIRKMCKRLCEGWLIGGIHFSENVPSAGDPEAVANNQ